VFRFPNKSALVALTAAVAIGLAGCSGVRSILPSAGPQAVPGVRNGHFSRVTLIKAQPPAAMQMGFLMTDGSVLAQGNNPASAWYRYVPDSSGDYSDGTWTQVASLPAGYAPSAFASAVQANGNLVITGGEYNTPGNYDLQLVNLGAVYNPVANTWTKLGHPKGWKWIGDSPSSVLPNGRYLVGQKLSDRDAYLNPKTLKWTSVPHTGKADFNAEEGWTLLPNGDILTADVKNAPNSEIYNPASGTWKSAGSTIVDLHSPSPYKTCLQYGPSPKDCYLPPGEIGPALLRPDGTVFATGSYSSGSGAGHTAIYHTTGSLAGTWTTGPNFPNGDSAGDSWGVVEPSGNVLIFGVFGNIYEWNGSTFDQVGTWQGPPVLLPTGQVMELGYSADVIYTPTGSAKSSWAPTITSVPKNLTPGSTYKISGTQFNGLSQGVAYGDEFQSATNYPLVRITNNASGKVYYARTHDVSSMGVATGSKIISTSFDVPKSIGKGASKLQVVANGIASTSAGVTIK
jgi:hypothetical protein